MTVAHRDFPTGSILTNGLGLGVNEGYMLASFHSLYLGIYVVKLPVSGGGGAVGGSAPGPMGGPLPITMPHKTHYTVTFSVKSSTSEWKRTLQMTQAPKDILVSIINILNVTRKFTKVTITNMKQTGIARAIVSKLNRITTNAKVLINKGTKQDSDK